jgi:small subunit ribosomal protein S6
MILHEYETIYIVRPDLPDDDVKRIQDKLDSIVLSFNGEIILKDDWGVRKLAYLVGKQARGRYAYLDFVATAACILELERVIRIESEVIRFMTVRLGENVDIEACKVAAVNRRHRPTDDSEPILDEDIEDFKDKDDEDGGMGPAYDRDRYDDNV